MHTFHKPYLLAICLLLTLLSGCSTSPSAATPTTAFVLPAPASSSPASSSSPLFSSGTLPSPSSTSSPTATRTPRPSSTPAPTRTPIPTGIPATLPVATVHPLLDKRLPELNYAVQYWHQDRWLRWEPATGITTTLVDLSPWRVDKNTELYYAGEVTLRLQRSETLYYTQTWTTTIEQIELQSGLITPIIQIPNGSELYTPGKLSISPDRQWLAYVLVHWDKTNGQVSDGEVYRVPLKQPFTPEKIGKYTPHDYAGLGYYVPQPPLWTPNNQQVVWTDVEGIWKGGSGIQHLLAPNDVIGSDHDHHNGFHLLSRPGIWSDTHRYVLLGGHYIEGAWSILLDNQHGGQTWVPDTSDDHRLGAEPVWLPGDELVTFHSPTYDKSSPASVQVWEAVTGPDLILRHEFILSFDYPFYSGFAHPKAQDQLDLLVLANNEDLGEPVTVDRVDEFLPWTVGLYRLNLRTQQIKKINDLPDVDFALADAFWAPDGSGVLLQGDCISSYGYIYKTFWIPVDGGPVVDLTTVVPGKATQIEWLTPAQN